MRLASGTWMYPSFEELFYECNFCFGWGQLDEARADIMDALRGEIMEWGISMQCWA